MNPKVKDNTIHVAEDSWAEFEKIANGNHILYDATISKQFKGHTQVEFYSKNDYIKVKTLFNKRNIPYKDRFSESIRTLIRTVIQEYLADK